MNVDFVASSIRPQEANVHLLKYSRRFEATYVVSYFCVMAIEC